MILEKSSAFSCDKLVVMTFGKEQFMAIKKVVGPQNDMAVILRKAISS